MLLLVILSILLSNTVAQSISADGDGGNAKEICGQVAITSGKISSLQEVPVTAAEFESVHVEKISFVQFIPNTESSCAINICEFTPYGEQIEKDYVGTASGYSDCQLITNLTHADESIYNTLQKFSIISLSCRCTKREDDCKSKNCHHNASHPEYFSKEKIIVFVSGIAFAAIVFTCFLACKFLQRLCNEWKTKRMKNEPHDDNELSTISGQFNKICTFQYLIPRKFFNIARNDLENPLGRGSFGIVCRGVLNYGNNRSIEHVAVKKICCLEVQQSTVHSCLREIRIFQKIGAASENILRFYGACCDNDVLFLLTEFCEGGSLETYLRATLRPQILNRRATPLQFLQFILWCEQIATGAEYLSFNGIIHMDLTTRNIRLKGNIAKICGFELSSECHDQIEFMDRVSWNSLAPELILDDSDNTRKYTASLNIWSYGCVVWEIFTLGCSLYPDVQIENFKVMQVIRQLKLGYRHPRPFLATDEVYSIMLECWQEFPEERPNFTYLRELFEGIRTNYLPEEY